MKLLKEKLTPKQLVITRLVALGKSNKEIAYLLKNSQDTIKQHLRTIFIRSKTPNRTALAIKYLLEEEQSKERLMIHAVRYHDISCGHRVVGHTDQDAEGNTISGPCARIHGHNYRIHFTLSPEIGKQLHNGMVLDFKLIKKYLCVWLDTNWDHRFLCWVEDPWRESLMAIDPSIVCVEFNPTAENIGLHLLEKVGPEILKGTGAVLTRCVVEETRKCSAEVELSIYH